MTKRALVILAVAAVMLAGAAAVIASSIGGGDDEPVHTLPGGQTHTGEMPSTSTNDGDTGTMDGMNMDE